MQFFLSLVEPQHVLNYPFLLFSILKICYCNFSLVQRIHFLLQQHCCITTILQTTLLKSYRYKLLQREGEAKLASITRYIVMLYYSMLRTNLHCCCVHNFFSEISGNENIIRVSSLRTNSSSY